MMKEARRCDLGEMYAVGKFEFEAMVVAVIRRTWAGDYCSARHDLSRSDLRQSGLMVEGQTKSKLSLLSLSSDSPYTYNQTLTGGHAAGDKTSWNFTLSPKDFWALDPKTIHCLSSLGAHIAHRAGHYSKHIWASLGLYQGQMFWQMISLL